jgi:hypothetical protein
MAASWHQASHTPATRPAASSTNTCAPPAARPQVYQQTSANRLHHEGFVEALPAAPSSLSSKWAQGSADAVRLHMWALEAAIKEGGVQDLLVLSGDHLYRMDYRAMLRAHREVRPPPPGAWRRRMAPVPWLRGRRCCGWWPGSPYRARGATVPLYTMGWDCRNCLSLGQPRLGAEPRAVCAVCASRT